MMRRVARDLVKEARAALESAASNGQPPPAWAQAFMTPAGWTHYQEVRDQAGAIPGAAATSEPACGPGALAGFHTDSPLGIPSGPYPPPARASYCCGSAAWMWREQEKQYVCATRQGNKQ